MENVTQRMSFIQLRRALANNHVELEDSYVSRLAESDVGDELVNQLTDLENQRDIASERE